MDKRIIVYVIAGILVAGLLILTFFPNMVHIVKDSGVNGEDKCIAPPGQTQEEWEEHMSHHPNVYKDCL